MNADELRVEQAETLERTYAVLARFTDRLGAIRAGNAQKRTIRKMRQLLALVQRFAEYSPADRRDEYARIEATASAAIQRHWEAAPAWRK